MHRSSSALRIPAATTNRRPPSPAPGSSLHHPHRFNAPHPRSSPLQAELRVIWTFGVLMAHQGIYLPPGDSAQQYYPNPYPHSSPLIQPPPPQQANHGPNQHYPSLARPSSFMPPPSTVPEDVNKWRNLQPQRPSNLWPRDVTEQQRHLQDRYSQNGDLHDHIFSTCSC